MRAAPKAASVWPSNHKQLWLGASLVAALAHLKKAVQFAAVMDASKHKTQRAAGDLSAGIMRSSHFVMYVGALPETAIAQPPTLGVIIPKRWAKRAVTRNTFKRQFYAVAQTYAQPLAEFLPGCGLVLRQTAAFASDEFVSARSPALNTAARLEIKQLFDRLLVKLGAKYELTPGAVA